MILEAVTFDFWNTLYWGRGTGFAEVRQLRLEALRVALAAGGVGPAADELERVNAGAFQAYDQARRAGRHFGAVDHVRHVLRAFGAREVGSALEDAAYRIEEAGARAPLSLLPGVAVLLPALSDAGIAMGLISDTGTTPGRVLMRFLERDGLLGCFRSFAFSDETGVVKPDPRAFLRTLAELGSAPRAAAHVGDLPSSDVAGAHRVGMRAVRFAGAADVREPPLADLVVRDHFQLLSALGVEGPGGVATAGRAE